MESNNEPSERLTTLASSIKVKLNTVPELNSEHWIYRVPAIYREINHDAFTPQFVSIGPFHQGTQSLQLTEGHKLRYLKDFLSRKPEQSIEFYLGQLKELEERTRECYGELISLTSDEFVEMMLFDGCFIIEFMLKSCDEELRDSDDPIFSTWMEEILIGDLKLFENQLPFFVMEHFFNLIKSHDIADEINSFLGLTLQCFCEELKISPSDFLKHSSNQIKHFTDLIQRCYVPSSPRMPPKDNGNIHFIPSATELHVAGVKFEKGTGNCFLDIKFTKKGVLSIPPLLIDGDTGNLFRNLVAYEHFNDDPSYVTDYTILIDSLINTPDDVALLRRHGIINNWLGDDSDVSLLFNDLQGSLSSTFYFAALYEDVNTYCNGRWHLWKAKLSRDYFNSPWSIIALIAAAIILLCTVTQAVCSILSLKS